MAQKRALVAMILIATNASDYFTQDMEDFVPSTKNPINPDDDFIDVQAKEVSATDQFKQEAGATEEISYLDNRVVSMVADKKGLSKQDAVGALNELLKDGKIIKKMTLAEFEQAI
jgi:hypothetical protein